MSAGGEHDHMEPFPLSKHASTHTLPRIKPLLVFVRRVGGEKKDFPFLLLRVCVVFLFLLGDGLLRATSGQVAWHRVVRRRLQHRPHVLLFRHWLDLEGATTRVLFF